MAFIAVIALVNDRTQTIKTDVRILSLLPEILGIVPDKLTCAQ
jgi:hypothetical protein